MLAESNTGAKSARVRFIDVPEVPGTGGCFQSPPVDNPIWRIPEGTLPYGDIQGELRTFGPWSIPRSYDALAIAKGGSVPTGMLRIYGWRRLSAPRESGYCLEGRTSVSAHGKRETFRAFTGSVRFIPAGGKGCIDVACLHVCIDADRCIACGHRAKMKPNMQNAACPKCGNLGIYAPGKPI